MHKRPKVKTILYATDLGGQTRPVFRHALSLADQYSADIIMLHVVEPMSETVKAVINTYLPKELTDEAQKDGMKDVLSEMKNRLKQFYEDESDNNGPALVKEVMVVAGKPSEEILRVAEEDGADMIVMGKSTRKVRGVRVMGSTARRVSRMSRVPVLVVPNY
ncbi:MAG: universal stress protein [Desulforhopalus sp.]